MTVTTGGMNRVFQIPSHFFFLSIENTLIGETFFFEKKLTILNNLFYVVVIIILYRTIFHA